MSIIRKTKPLFCGVLLFLVLCVASHGSAMTLDETNQYMKVPIAQWQKLKNELIALNNELILYQQDLTKLKKPTQNLVEELNQAQLLQKKLETELTDCKTDLTVLSKEVEELRTSSQILKQKINKERAVHRRQIWQNRIWCLLIGVGVGCAVK